MNKDMTMNLTVSSPASPVPAAAPAGPALKWMWAAIGALGVSVLALGATPVSYTHLTLPTIYSV